MTEHLTLPEKLRSSSCAELTRLLQGCTGNEIHIDGRSVRMMGARAAECLVRFVRDIRSTGGQISIRASEAMRDDLLMLGLHRHLMGKDPAP